MQGLFYVKTVIRSLTSVHQVGQKQDDLGKGDQDNDTDDHRDQEGENTLEDFF